MDPIACTYCLIEGEYGIIKNGTKDDDIEPNQQVSIRIELWNNFQDFACSWQWNGSIDYYGSIETLEPSDGKIVYCNIVIVVCVLLSVFVDCFS